MKSEPGYVGCQVFAEPRYPPSIDRGQETGEPRTPRLVGNEMLAWCNSGSSLFGMGSNDLSLEA
jgi:hypothetical protein